MQNIKQKKYLIKQELIKATRRYNKSGRQDTVIKWDIEGWTEMLDDYINCGDKPFTSDIEYRTNKVDRTHDMTITTRDSRDYDKWKDIELDYKKIGGKESLDYYSIRQAYLR